MSRGVYITRKMALLMAEMRTQGATHQTISDQLGCAKSTVSRALKRLGSSDSFETPNARRAREALVHVTAPLDHTAHLNAILTIRPQGFPVAFSRAHFRLRAA